MCIRDSYQIDASNGVFVETAVRFDEALAADQAWWAFWLMTPGGLNTGNPADDFAYNNNATSGSEVDIFEYVPDSQNGFNTAIFSARPMSVPKASPTTLLCAQTTAASPTKLQMTSLGSVSKPET